MPVVGFGAAVLGGVLPSAAATTAGGQSREASAVARGAASHIASCKTDGFSLRAVSISSGVSITASIDRPTPPPTPVKLYCHLQRQDLVPNGVNVWVGVVLKATVGQS